MSGKTYHRILSAVVCVSLFLNSLWGVFLYPQTVFAEESSESAELEQVEETAPTPTPSPEPNNEEPTTDSLTEDLEEPQTSDESAALVPSVWVENEDGSVTTSESVGEGIEYRYKDTQVKVVFTKLTTPGYLTIREFEPENAEELGIVGKAYEITSDMQDGTFEYNLTLPVSGETSDNLSVKYAENPDELSNAQVVNEPTEVVDNTITIKGLIHFTVFIVVPNSSPPPESFLEIIIDNTDPEFSVLSGNWRDSTSVSGWYGSNYKTTDERAETEQVKWEFQVKENGPHEVYTRWTAWPNRGTSVPYTVNYKDGSDIISVNQEQNGGQWNLLGTYDFNAGINYSVVLTNNATNSSNYVIADAIKIKSTKAPGEVWVDDGWSGNFDEDIVGDGKIFGYNAFATIQEGINAVQGSTVNVAAGTYNENININKGLTLQSVSGATNTTILGTTGTVVTINADNVVIDGFTIINGNTHGTGIYSSDHSDLTITNNIITAIGNSDNNTAGQGIVIVSSASSVDNIVITSNQINDITSGLKTGSSSTSAKGIAIGWSDGNYNITGLFIQGNVISNINADTSPWGITKGQGAYGILLNHADHTSPAKMGSTIGAQITNNTISGLEGLWAHAIGLEGDTPDAVITGNTISNLVDHKSPSDAVGVQFEANPSAGTVTFTNNTFTSVPVNIQNTVAETTVDARNNTWSVTDQDNVDQVEAVINQNCSSSPFVHGVCGTGDNAGYGFVKYEDIGTPSNSGWNVKSKSFTPNETPLDLACSLSGIYTNENSIAQNWTGINGVNIKYQREVVFPSTAIGYYGAGTNTYTPFSAFGSSTGIEGLWKTRVRAFVDANSNGSPDSSEETSVWSNQCSIVYDRTTPVTSEPLSSPEDGSFWNEPIQILGISTDNFWTDLLNLFYKPAGSSDQWEDITSLSNPQDDAVFEWSYFWTPAEGIYDIMAAAVDAAGNEETSAYAEDITYDVTDPSVPVLTWPIDNEFTNDNTPLMQWDNSTDGGGSGVVGYYYRVYYNCSNPNDIPASCSSVYPNSEGLWRSASEYQAGTTGDGVYYWQVRAKDYAGNLSDWSELEKVAIDTNSPAAPMITSPEAEEYFNSAPIPNQWTAVTDLSGIDEYRIQYEYDDGHTFSGYPFRTTTNTWRNHTPGSGEQGGVEFRVQAFDNAGNEGEWSDWRHYFYDIEAPDSPTLLSISNGTETNDTTPTLTWEQPSDNLDPYGINNKAGFDNYRIQVASNLEFVSPEKNYYTDNNSYTPSLGEGVWYWRVKARDDAENWGDWSEVWQFTVDITAPASQPTSPAQGFYNADTWDGIILGTASDNLSGVNKIEVSVKVVTPDPVQTLYWDGDSWEDEETWLEAAGTTSWNYTVTPIEGTYTFYSRATDNAGNLEATGELTGIIYDTTAPQLTWTSPTENTIISGTTVVLSTATDNLSEVASVTYSYQRNDGVDTWHEIANLTNSPYQVDWDTTGLALDDYKLKALATDKSGNSVKAIRSVSVAAVISGETWSRPEFGKITVSWTTDRATSGRVVYDTTSHSIDPNHPNYGYANTSGVVDSSPKTTSHTVTLSELLNGITYYWRTVSTGSPIVISEEHRGDTFSIPSPGGDGGGAVAGLTTDTTTTPFVTGEIGEISVSEEEEVLGEETTTITQPEDLGGFGESVLGKSKVIRVILWGGAALGGLILIYFFFRRRKRR